MHARPADVGAESRHLAPKDPGDCPRSKLVSLFAVESGAEKMMMEEASVGGQRHVNLLMSRGQHRRRADI